MFSKNANTRAEVVVVEKRTNNESNFEKVNHWRKNGEMRV